MMALSLMGVSMTRYQSKAIEQAFRCVI